MIDNSALSQNMWESFKQEWNNEIEGKLKQDRLYNKLKNDIQSFPIEGYFKVESIKDKGYWIFIDMSKECVDSIYRVVVDGVKDVPQSAFEHYDKIKEGDEIYVRLADIKSCGCYEYDPYILVWDKETYETTDSRQGIGYKLLESFYTCLLTLEDPYNVTKNFSIWTENKNIEIVYSAFEKKKIYVCMNLLNQYYIPEGNSVFFKTYYCRDKTNSFERK